MTLKEKSFTFPPQRTSQLTPAVNDDVEEREPVNLMPLLSSVSFNRNKKTKTKFIVYFRGHNGHKGHKGQNLSVVVFFFSGKREKVARESYASERTRALSQRIIKKKKIQILLFMHLVPVVPSKIKDKFLVASRYVQFEVRFRTVIHISMNNTE